ncbi:hypothetical protein LOTGIDRAFT_203293 [Lottia gigantea]|uniref:Coactosin-like protein n=1 Tax=Lottia gigantea TaxID=225164 RepID=V3ZKA6_LOTGI|nr:hypothetical protein LOTGIDRAFT_203293 [Lottia gigantea]ESO82810.1 hypothetical protein LOTGIDRAFT_203293 [Lottia gigantea]
MSIGDTESLRDAYEEVRSDKTDTNWAVLKYDGNTIVLEDTGTDFGDFKSRFTDDERKYGYLRVVTGDELSKRSKFVFIAWCGNDISAIKKARLGTDKAHVKNIMSNFAIELLVSEHEELEEEQILQAVRKAGGANYGTGQ